MPLAAVQENPNLTKTKILAMLIRELLYADDAVFIAHCVEDMQLIMDRFSLACTAFRLTVSLKKTKTMFTPAQGNLIPDWR